jgi:hypothetical protein
LARPSKHDGSIYPRKDGKVLWMVYRNRCGKRIRESTNTDDWQEAQRKLRERLQARDEKVLDIVRKGEQLKFADWVDFFLENYSKPPMRAEKTHEANERVGRHLKEAFGDRSIREISADDIEVYLSKAATGEGSDQDQNRGVSKRPPQTSDSPSRAAGASPYAERRRPQETAPSEPVRRSGISGQGERTVPGTRVFAQHR